VLGLRGVPESRLIPIMAELDARFPGLKLFSLPHLGDDPADRYVLLGFRGVGDLSEAMDALTAALEQAGMAHEPAVADSR